MLKNESKKITISAQSVVTVIEDGVSKEVAVKGFTATIDSANPENMSINEYYQGTNGKDLYKEHRSECRADEAAFEDMVYDLQDEMIANM